MIHIRKTLPILVLVLFLTSGMPFAQMDESMASRLDKLCAVEGLGAEDALQVNFMHMDESVPVYHLQQYHRGIKVWGALTNVREEGRELNVAARNVFRGINIGIEPSLSAANILSIVDMDLARGLNSPPHRRPAIGAQADADDGHLNSSEKENLARIRYLSTPELELTIFPVQEQWVRPEAARKSDDQLNAEDVQYVVTGYRLAYHVKTDAEVDGRRELMNYLVDAHSGEIMKKWNMVKRGAVAGTAYTKYSGTVTLYTNLNGSTYEAKDPTYFNNYVSSSTSSSTPYTDADNVWGNGGNWADGTTVARQTGAAEALYALQRECQMLKGVWNRNGSSGTGTAMKVVWGQYAASNTACYITQNYIISGYADSYFYDMNKLDILGHEYGHSFDYYTSGLCMDDTGEGGGMGEAHSDIMGLLTEVYGKYTANNPSSPATTIPEQGLTDPKTWICGEDAAKSTVNGGKGLRFFIKPSWDTLEGTIDAWKTTMASVEVHAAAGPTDRMFYYLAVGAPSSTSHDGYTSYLPNGSAGIGLHKAAMIWVKAMTSGQLTSSSKHVDARNACISAAKTLYGAGGPEEQAVWNAYHGVNVGAAWGGDALAITTHPSSQTVTAGSNVTFTVAASGGTTPYSYKWYRNGSVVSGATSASYTFTTASTDNGATFYAMVTDSAASPATVTSNTATLTISTSVTFNEAESNGSITAANAVPDNATKIVGYIGTSTDNDYFKIRVGAGRTLKINMTGPAKDYDLYLYNSSGTTLKSSTGSTATESVTYTNSGTSAVYYYARVKGYNGAYTTTTPYNLALSR